MDLAEFLLARVAEEEGWARDADPGDWPLGDWATSASWYFVERWSPARVLAECEAKRRIVELHERAPWTSPSGAVCGHEETLWPCADLRLMAAVYADHPDYQPEWAPTVAV